jgi:hypothetical protein
MAESAFDTKERNLKLALRFILAFFTRPTFHSLAASPPQIFTMVHNERKPKAVSALKDLPR